MALSSYGVTTEQSAQSDVRGRCQKQSDTFDEAQTAE
jgi:hypothetical protein